MNNNKEIFTVIDTKSPVPLYYQIKQSIMDVIKSGSLISDRLPSERVMGEIFKVNRLTIRRALNELFYDGYIYTSHGVGSFVVKSKIEQRMHQLSSFTEDMLSDNLVPSTKMIFKKIILPEYKIAQKLLMDEKEEVVHLIRLRIANSEKLILDDIYLNHSLCMEILKFDLEKQSLYQILTNNYKVKLKNAVQYFEAKTADQYESKVLQIKLGSPVFFSEALIYTEDQKPIEYTRSVYRGDKFILKTELGEYKPKKSTDRLCVLIKKKKEVI